MKNSVVDSLLTIKDYIRWGSSLFEREGLYFGHGTDNAWDEAAVLVLWVVNQPWERLELISDTRLDGNEKQQIVALFERRVSERLPAAYLTGEAWFAGFKFEVTSDTLVPRSPIAELLLDQFQPWLRQEPTAILDLCTGGGCIGIASAMVFESADVDLVDVSKAALKVADRNIHLHQLEQRVKTVHSNLFDSLGDVRYDLILSNPPYVDARDLASMPAEYHKEPVIGLASGEDGLDITRQILKQAYRYLSEEGLLVVEVGNSWEALENAYPSVSFLWPELQNGGHGVFLLTRSQLKALGESE